MIDSNEFESALSSTNFSLSSLFRASQTQILIYYFSLDLFDQISNTARIRIESFASSSKPLRFLILLTVPSFQFFLLLPHRPPAGHPLKNLYRITFGSRSLLFGRTRTFARRPDNSCLPLHTIDVPFRRASDLFCLFSLFLFLFLPLSSHDSPHAWSRAHLEEEGMSIVTIVKWVRYRPLR